jgi:hypothetical protein
MKKFWLVLSWTLFSSLNANAGVEIRGHYGMWMTPPSDFTDALKKSVPNYPELPGPTVMGADLLYTAKNVVVGLRYEDLSAKKDGSAVISSLNVDLKTKFTGNRISVLGGYRFADTANYFAGVLGHIAVSQKADYSIETSVMGSSSTADYEGKPDMSYGAALEGGMKFNHFLLGLEAGYVSYKIKEFTNKSGGATFKDSSGNNVTMTMTGPYARALLGFGF